jgi:glutamate dehydrogenase/leucine dehydrogenase
MACNMVRAFSNRAGEGGAKNLGAYLIAFVAVPLAGGKPIPREDASFLALPCDVVVVAALGGSINHATAPLLQCQAVVEGANAAVTPSGDDILKQRGTCDMVATANPS